MERKDPTLTHAGLAIACWPIVLGVLITLICATGCRPASPRELAAAKQRELTAEKPESYSLTLYSEQGDTLYHCGGVRKYFWMESGAVRFLCEGSSDWEYVKGTVVLRKN